ncbi:MAG: prepilin peptidase [Phycisphaerae bacterium]|nr:prepilin peptidase [Phycisphaerae bacterium]
MDAYWIILIFLFGACVGSFLNVVIYRVPRGLNIAFPGSQCPGCGRAIRWFDNVPLLSWLVLRGRCRFCKNPISPRYIIIEAVTALLVVGLYVAYFMLHVRTDLTGGLASAWPGRNPLVFTDAWSMFVAHAALLCGLLVCSAVDIEMWIVPLEVTWVVSLIGLVAATADPHPFMRAVAPTTGAVALAAGVGLILALILMRRGYIRQSFRDAVDVPAGPPGAEADAGKSVESASRGDGKKDRKARKAALKARMTKPDAAGERAGKPHAKPKAVALTSAHGVNPRVEMLHELLFLAPALLLAVGTWALMRHVPAARDAWASLFDTAASPLLAPHLGGAVASIFGYLIGGLWIWGTRIVGTLAFGKEAMGMGDVHLLACVGAVAGWVVPTAAFFVGPFLGLLWAIWLVFRRNQRELPYGPWLAVASVLVMLFYDVFAGVFQQYGETLNLLFTR